MLSQAFKLFNFDFVKYGTLADGTTFELSVKW